MQAGDQIPFVFGAVAGFVLHGAQDRVSGDKLDVAPKTRQMPRYSRFEPRNSVRHFGRSSTGSR